MGVTNAISIGIGGYINIRYQRTLLKEMDEMYRHDALTGLFNRIGFQNQLKALLAMTPHIHRINREQSERLEALDSLELTVNYKIRVLGKGRG